MHVDLMLINISQLVTLAGGPQRGSRIGQLGLIEDGALAIESGRIVAVGSRQQITDEVKAEKTLDAGGNLVLPGFIDPHTHLIWAGDRADEFEKRTAGVPYLDILKAGGGILATVRHTRQASLDHLINSGRRRLQRMIELGSTTVEAKTGYGLDAESEIRLLTALIALDEEGPWDLVPTLLGGHAIPPEFDGRADDYVRYVVEDMLPTVRQWWEQNTDNRPLPFFDAFCEEGAFDLEQSRRMLQAARQLGFPLKLHADEFVGLGGTAMAVELGATSVDHLVETPAGDIKALGNSITTAVSLPCTPFGLGQDRYTPVQQFLEAGAVLAIATDFNPGTAPCESMQFAMAVACRQMKLTPAQAIAAATINAATAIGRAETHGSLEPGKMADFLIMEVQDYRQLGYRFGGNLVSQVFKGGQLVVDRT